MATWAQLRDAVQAWARALLGYDGEHVVWARQGGVRPAEPFATLTWTAVVAVHLDGVKETYDAGRPNGQEVAHTALALREATLSVQVFGPDALAAVDALMTGARLPGRAELLAAGDASLLGFGQVRDLSALLGPEFEGRAQVDVRIGASRGATVYTGYVDTVQIEDLATGTVFEVHSG